VGSIPEPLAALRVHPGQTTRDLKLIMVRSDDNRRLAEAMLDIPGFSRAARQAAQLRRAGACLRLGRRLEALRCAALAVREAPWLLPCNHLLWRRAAFALRRKITPLQP
jgi:hypothetical protein